MASTSTPTTRKWLSSALKTAAEVQETPLPFQRGQRRAAVRARLLDETSPKPLSAAQA